MPNLASVVSVIFPLMTILAVGGCALLYGVTSTLRASNGDLRERVNDLVSEGESKDARIKALEDTSTGQKGELDALRKVVTGEVQLVAITDLLEQHHTQAVKEWHVVNELLTRIDITMAGALAMLRDRPTQ